MKITQTTTKQDNISRIEKSTEKTTRLINIAIDSLNESYRALWSLPDEELREVLQEMINEGTMASIFTAHYVTATALNTIQEHSGETNRAIAIAGREYVIEDNIITITPLPIPEIIEEPIIEP
jgi:hypothetical protein